MTIPYLRISDLSLQDIQRYWTKVSTGSPDTCWPWIAGKDTDGYGCFRVSHPRRANFRAHRIAYFLHYGEDPSDLVIRHLVCDNPPCCNGLHLAKGTLADNRQDCVNKNRQAKGERHNLTLHPELIKRGEETPWAKLRESDVLLMRKLYQQGWKVFHIAQFFPYVDQTTVWHAIKNHTWKHL